MDEAKWDDYVEHARRCLDSGKLKGEEYKREAERDLR